MKVLSVCQPWAWLLVNGYKDVENRSWATQHRGPLLIHAGKCKSAAWKRSRFADDAAIQSVFGRLREMGINPPAIPAVLEFGGIVGRVTLLDCVRGPHSALVSPWFVGPVGWLVSEASPLPFTPLRGRLHLFDYPG